MANFNPAQEYAWSIVTTGGGIAGFAAEDFTLDTAGVANGLAGGSFKLSVVGMDLVLSFTQAPPTAVGLAYFDAVPVGEGEVRLGWGTLVEYDVIGFQVDRWPGKGDWERVTPQIIPATGWGQQPQSYGAMDVKPWAAARSKYRLVEVNLRGQERVVAEATVQAAITAGMTRTSEGLSLEVHGVPNATVVVEATASVMGPWTSVLVGTLDSHGASTFSVAMDHQASAWFFRVMSE
jgi:hypothetical protein